MIELSYFQVLSRMYNSSGLTSNLSGSSEARRSASTIIGFNYKMKYLIVDCR